MKSSKRSKNYFNNYKHMGFPVSNLPDGVMNFKVGGFRGYSGGIIKTP